LVAVGSYLVCATQRSGSTLLCELLKDTGVAGRPEEFFEGRRDTGLPPHPGDFLQGLERTGVGIRADDTPADAPPYSKLLGLGSYRDHLERTFAWGTTENGVFGAKLMWNQLPELHSLAGALPEYRDLTADGLLTRLFNGPSYVYAYRADKVRQAVSMWKALQTRSWRQGGGRDGQVELRYHYKAIDHLVSLFESDDRGWRSFFAEHEIEPLMIGYEDDLEQAPEETVRMVLALLGVRAPAGWRARAPMERQADERSDRWVAAYHRDRAVAAEHPLSQLA
jgi:LPS sulfotransferase NodH